MTQTASDTETAPTVGEDTELRARGDRPADAGTTLIEVLIAIVLLATVIAAIVGALLTSVLASSTAFDGAELNTMLLNASDRIQRADQSCDYEVHVDAAATANGWDTALVNSSVEILVRDTSGTRWDPMTCPNTVEPFQVQRITITATHPDGSITRTLEVVKSSVI